MPPLSPNFEEDSKNKITTYLVISNLTQAEANLMSDKNMRAWVTTVFNCMDPFGICLLNSTANLAQFGWQWAAI